ncbi:MAG: hypothetical protein CMH54_04195 [Myxococcales bacterium]|nr:hypothetical protein [Myxococcales bacterium]
MLTGLGNLVYVLGSWVLCFLLPGCLLASLATRRFTNASITASLALCWGFSLFFIPAVLFAVAAAVQLPITYGFTLGLTALWLGLGYRHLSSVAAFMKRLLESSRWREMASEHRWLLALVTVAFLYQLLFFDTGFHYLCTYKPVAIASGYGEMVGHTGANTNFWYEGHQRWGVSALLSPAYSLFGYIGLRIFWGDLFAFIPLAAWVVARRTGLSRSGALATSAIAALLPWVAGAADQNRVVLALTFFVALILVLKDWAPLFFGFALGLLLAAEPVAILGVIVFGLALRRRLEWTGSDLLYFLAGVTLGLGPALLRYKLAYGSFFFHEHFTYVPAVPYEIMGMTVSFPGFLNWPLADELLRSPFNALPNLAIVPLMLLRQFGLIAFVVVCFGAVDGFRKRKLWAITWAYAIPILIFLSLNENWVERDKWDIAIMAFLPMYLAFGAGFEWLYSQGKKAIVFLALGVGISFGMHQALNSLDAQADTRMWASYERLADRLEAEEKPSSWARLPAEDTAYLEVERQYFQEVHLLPGIHREIGTRHRANLSPHDLISRIRLLRKELGSLYYNLAAKTSSTSLQPSDAVGAIRWNLQYAPTQGLLPDGLSQLPIGVCAEGEKGVVIADASPHFFTVEWSDQPISVMFQSDPLRNLSAIIVQRRTKMKVPSQVEKAQCLQFPVVRGHTVLFVDQISIEPSRAYSYRVVQHDPETLDLRLLTR